MKKIGFTLFFLFSFKSHAEVNINNAKEAAAIIKDLCLQDTGKITSFDVDIDGKLVIDSKIKGKASYEVKNQNGAIAFKEEFNALISDQQSINCAEKHLDKLMDYILPSRDNNKTDEYIIIGTMYPLIETIETKTFNEEREVYRSSCSGSQVNTFTFCTSDGYIMNGFDASVISSRNGRIRSKTKKSNLCADIVTHVASGGRTFLGECRYHGYIKIKSHLTGIKSSTRFGEAVSFQKRGKFNEIFFPYTGVENQNIARWEFNVNITRIKDGLETTTVLTSEKSEDVKRGYSAVIESNGIRLNLKSS